MTAGMSEQQLAEIRADLDAVPAPPWRWIGNRSAGGPQLVTDHSGRQYLLRAKKPTDGRGDEVLDPATDYPVYGDLEFRDQRAGEQYATMRAGDQLAVGRTDYDPDSIVGIDNSMGRWIERSATHAAALLAEVDRLRARVTAQEKAVHDALTKMGTAERRAVALELQAAKVAEFVAERAEVVTAGRNCHPDNHSERGRWQGHAEARRVLAVALGQPVAWPAETTVGGDPR